MIAFGVNCGGNNNDGRRLEELVDGLLRLIAITLQGAYYLNPGSR